jgi:hypothetical protein
MRRAVCSNGGALVSKAGNGRFDPCTACCNDLVVEWRGIRLQSGTTQVQILPRSFKKYGDRSLNGQSAGL